MRARLAALAPHPGVAQHGGEVSGDGGAILKAAFGADGMREGTREDDAEPAVGCGLALLDEAVRRGQALHRTQDLGGFDARVGVQTGDQWQALPERLQEWKVPATLVRVLQASLDAPAPALALAKGRSLQQASAVGLQFWDELPAAIEARAHGLLPEITHREMAIPAARSAFEGAREFNSATTCCTR